MYDLKPKFSHKLSQNSSKHYPNNSLPKLTITSDDCIQSKLLSYSHRKQTTRSHNFLELFNLHKAYLSSSQKKTNKKLYRSKGLSSNEFRGGKIQGRNSSGLENKNSFNEQINVKKLKINCQDDDISFCKRKLKEFQEQVVIIRDRLMLENSLRLRSKTENEGYLKNESNHFILNNEQKSNLLSIRSTKLETKVCNFVKKRNKKQQKQKLSRLCPQSQPLKNKKYVLSDQFSPWDYNDNDHLNTQI